MKTMIPFLCSILVFISCKQSENNKSEIKLEAPKNGINQFVPKYGNPFFVFDEIEFYHTEIDEDKAMALFDTQNTSQIDKLKFDIIVGNQPENLKDLKFIQTLPEIGFKKSNIAQSKLKEIHKIFTEKTASENYAASCVPVYRDILVFKKDKNTVGFCKICFDCGLFKMIGTSANTENFGQDGDFEKLSKLLAN